MTQGMWFNFALKAYTILQSVVLDRLSPAVRQRCVLLAYRVGRKLFPDRIAHNDEPRGVERQQNQPWLAPELPAWLVTEMKELGKIDCEVYSDISSISRYAFYSIPQDPRAGVLWRQLYRDLAGRGITHVVVGPWLKQGGADRLTLLHIELLAGTPGVKPLLITTEPSGSPWLERLPDDVQRLELGRSCSDLPFGDQMLVLARLLVQLQPRAIHIINSRLAWETIQRYGKAISGFSKVYASLFCDDMSSEMIPVGYARSYLSRCSEYLKLVFTDNSVSPRVWSQQLGVEASKFRVLPSPYIGTVSDRYACDPTSTRILWAGRLDRQKRPDLLIDVARLRPDLQFDVYGVPVLERSMDSRLRSVANIALKGEFSSFANLAHGDYRLFLFTSGWEGLPNVLLDAVSAGMSIVASKVGGVEDLLGDGGAVLISSDKPAHYAEALDVLSQRETAEKMWRTAKDRLLATYSSANFSRAVRDAPDYLVSGQ